MLEKFNNKEEAIKDYLLYYGLKENQIQTWINQNNDFCIRKIGTIGHNTFMAYKIIEE
jgi:hypothetical protein